MRNKNKRVRFAEADNVGSLCCETYACEMVNNVKTPLELERPKTSEYKFYRRTLEKFSRTFCCNEEPHKEDSCAKMEEKKLSKEGSHSSWSRHWEKRAFLPTGKVSPLRESGSPHASQIQASSDLNLCTMEPRWPFIASQVPQSLALQDNDIRMFTPNSPSNVSQVPQIVTSKESGLQYQQGQVFLIKRQRLRELAASTLSLCLDEFLLLGSDAIPKLLQRIGIQKNGGSNTRMLGSISNEKHFNNDNADLDNYVISRNICSSPSDFGDNKLSRSFNGTDTYHSKLASPSRQGKDAAVPILLSPSGSFIAPMDGTSSSLGWPDFFSWDAHDPCNGQCRVDEMMLDSTGCTSDYKFHGIYEPFCVTRSTMGGIGKFTEAERRRRSKYYTATDMPSDFASLDCKTLPCIRRGCLDEPLGIYDLEEMDSKDIIGGLEVLNTRRCCRRVLLDSNDGKGTPDELIPRLSIAGMASESFVKWLSDIGMETLSSPLKFPFQSQSYTLQSGLLPGINSHDFCSSYNMVSPWVEHIIENDNFQCDEQPFLKCSAENYHYHPQLESRHSIRLYDVNNRLPYTPSTSKHTSEDVVCASWKYLLPPSGLDIDTKNPRYPLALDYP